MMFYGRDANNVTRTGECDTDPLAFVRIRQAAGWRRCAVADGALVRAVLIDGKVWAR